MPSKKQKVLPQVIFEMAMLPCQLTDSELTDVAIRFSQIQVQIHDRVAELKSVTSSRKEEIKLLQEEASTLRQKLITKKEDRPVSVKETINVEDNEFTRVREDTGEVLFSRELHPSERQTGLDLNEESRADGDGESPESEDTPPPDTDDDNPFGSDEDTIEN